MGTNYYLQRKKPNGRCFDMHICKLSYGWTPSMHGYKQSINSYEMLETDPDISSWRQWKFFILREKAKGALLFNEYDDVLSFREFVNKVETHMEYANEKGWSNHAQKVHEQELLGYEASSEELQRYWIDELNYSFSATEFF